MRGFPFILVSYLGSSGNRLGLFVGFLLVFMISRDGMALEELLSLLTKVCSFIYRWGDYRRSQ